MSKSHKKLISEVMREMGQKGGSRNTPKQQAARALPKKNAGRPKKIK